jgi:APA family basic amino acid/polyamine antiporter
MDFGKEAVKSETNNDVAAIQQLTENVKETTISFRKPIVQRQSSHPFRRKPLPHPSIGLENAQSKSRKGRPSWNRSYSFVSSSDTDEGVFDSVDGLTKIPNDDSAPEDETENIHEGMDRHLTLLDLIAIGIGGTIGSGLFVLVGLVANKYAGPATVLSWCLSGLSACISGVCYAELSARIPLAGGAYAYASVALGELFSVLCATCLSMNYIAASAAIARSWGDKCIEWLQEELGDEHWIPLAFHPWGSLSPLAFFISFGSVVLLLNGVKESKRVTNFFTAVKASVAVFMVIAGFYYAKPANWHPFLPAKFGVPGVMRGATATFFGYLGYDSVCCLGGEAINPKRNLPIAILMTLSGVVVLYVSATLALTGMQPYDNISPVSGFPHAFFSLDAVWAGQIAAVGEIFTLPIVVLITIMAEPRLMLALGEDGLLPPFLKSIDEHGNLWNGTFVSGTIMVVVATFVPFEHLNDMISFAVLSILNMTDSSLIFLWHEAPNQHSRTHIYLVVAYHVAALATAYVFTHLLHSFVATLFASLSLASMVVVALCIFYCCPRSQAFGGRRAQLDATHLETTASDGYFRTPLVPFWPCMGIFINWYLIAQLELVGIVSMLSILSIACSYYFVIVIRCHRANPSALCDTATPCSLEMATIENQKTKTDDTDHTIGKNILSNLDRSVLHSLPEVS